MRHGDKFTLKFIRHPKLEGFLPVLHVPMRFFGGELTSKEKEFVEKFKELGRKFGVSDKAIQKYVQEHREEKN